MASGNDAQVAVPWPAHVGQVITDLELEQGYWAADPAVSVVVAVDVPAHVPVLGPMLHDGVRGVVMRALVQQACNVGPEGGPVEEFQEKRIVVQDVE